MENVINCIPWRNGVIAYVILNTVEVSSLQEKIWLHHKNIPKVQEQLQWHHKDDTDREGINFRTSNILGVSIFNIFIIYYNQRQKNNTYGS